MRPAVYSILVILSMVFIAASILLGLVWKLGWAVWYADPVFTSAVGILGFVGRLSADRSKSVLDKRRDLFRVLAVGVCDGTGAELDHVREQFEERAGIFKDNKRRDQELVKWLKQFSRDLYQPETYLVQLLPGNRINQVKAQLRDWLRELNACKEVSHVSG